MNHWVFNLLTLEWRKVFAYRVNFWIQFFGDILIQFLVAYFLWKAVYSYNGVNVLGGFSYNAILLYSVCIPIVGKMSRGTDFGFISQDIYDGGLSKYLIYPASFFLFKYTQRFSDTLLFTAQFIMVLIVYNLFWQAPEDVHFSAIQMLLGIFTILIGGICFFFLGCIIELIAFWADQVWSLMIMLRFVTNFLGGAMIPLSFFPNELSVILKFMPFYYLLGFPVSIFIGKIDTQEVLFGILILIGWTIVFLLSTLLIWRAGLKRYSGIGI